MGDPPPSPNSVPPINAGWNVVESEPGTLTAARGVHVICLQKALSEELSLPAPSEHATHSSLKVLVGEYELALVLVKVVLSLQCQPTTKVSTTRGASKRARVQFTCTWIYRRTGNGRCYQFPRGARFCEGCYYTYSRIAAGVVPEPSHCPGKHVCKFRADGK